MKPLPKTLFAYINLEGTEQEVIYGHGDLQQVKPCPGRRQRVGEYVLKREFEVTRETVVVAEVG